MFKAVDIIFFVEHKDRELESVNLIASKLREKGKKVLILSANFHVYYLFIYKCQIFVFPYLLNKNDWPVSLVYKIYGDSVAYFNMNWEQLLFPVNLEYKKPQDSFVKEVVKHISWGENFTNYLTKNGVSNKNIKITGNPANEVLHKLLPYRDLWKDKLALEFNLSKKKEWLFMPMNYAWAFSSDKLIQAKIEKGYPKEFAWEHREYTQKCIHKFIDFIEYLSREDSYEIIIRPHPSITRADYLQVFNEVLGYVPLNIHIIKNHSIREWIVASDLIGSSWSTSVWDAYKVKKSVFLFTPYPRPEWLEVWWNKRVLNLHKASDMDKITTQTSATDLEEINSCENIATFIDSHMPRKPRISLPLLNYEEFRRILRGILYDKFKILINKSLLDDYFKHIKVK